MQFAISRERGARRCGGCGMRRIWKNRACYFVMCCFFLVWRLYAPCCGGGRGEPIVCIMPAQGIIHVTTCHYARIQLRMQSSQLDTCCRQCSVSCPTTHLHLYFLWGSNPRPVAHKTIASATELRELHAIKNSGGCAY